MDRHIFTEATHTQTDMAINRSNLPSTEAFVFGKTGDEFKTMPSFKKQTPIRVEDDYMDESAFVLSDDQGFSYIGKTTEKEQTFAEKVLSMPELVVKTVDGMNPPSGLDRYKFKPNTLLNKDKEVVEYVASLKNGKTEKRSKTGVLEWVNYLRSHTRDQVTGKVYEPLTNRDVAAQYVWLLGPDGKVVNFKAVQTELLADTESKKSRKKSSQPEPEKPKSQRTTQPVQENIKVVQVEAQQKKRAKADSSVPKGSTEKHLPVHIQPIVAPLDITKSKFMVFHSLKNDGQFDMIAQATEAIAHSGLEAEEYNHILTNYESLHSKFVGESKKRKHVSFSYENIDDFIHQSALEFSKITKANPDDAIAAFKLVDKAISYSNLQ